MTLEEAYSFGQLVQNAQGTLNFTRHPVRQREPANIENQVHRLKRHGNHCGQPYR